MFPVDSVSLQAYTASMLFFGIIAAVALIIDTRKTEIVTHDPSEGLPGSGGAFKGVVDSMREVARQMEQQARAAQQEQQQDSEPGPLPRRESPSGPALEEIRDLAQRGQALDAIKLYRRYFRVDLKTSKEAVDRLAAGQ